MGKQCQLLFVSLRGFQKIIYIFFRDRNERDDYIMGMKIFVLEKL